MKTTFQYIMYISETPLPKLDPSPSNTSTILTSHLAQTTMEHLQLYNNHILCNN